MAGRAVGHSRSGVLARVAEVGLATRLAESSIYRGAIREKLGLAASKAYCDVTAIDALAAVVLEHSL